MQGFEFLRLDRAGFEGNRDFHRDDRHELSQVILDHVAERSGLLVVGPSMLDAEVFRDGDLDVLHRVAVPDRFEDRVGKAKRQEILHGLFAQVVIDPIDLGLLKVAMQQRIQGPGRMKVVSEWFLDHDADPAATLEECGAVQSFNGAGHGGRRQGQVEHSILAHAMRLLHALNVRRQRLIVLRTPLEQRVIVETLVAPGAQVFFIAPARFL